MSDPSPSFLAQAARLRELIPSMKMSDGSPAARCFMEIDREDAAFLEGIANRLDRMSFHEAAIRRIVTGKR